MKYFALCAGLLVVLTAVATGCGQDAGETVAEKLAEKAIESSAAESGESVDANVDVSSGTVTITGQDDDGKALKMKFGNESASIVSEDGATEMLMGDAAKIPADFPKDVPVYPGMKLEMTVKNPQDGMFTLTGTSADPLDKIAKFYKGKAAAGGWTEQMSMAQGGQMQMLAYEKGGRMISVNIISQDGSTTINLTTGTQ
jgi:uncharacterized cupredoxin-like copper-binding protein